MKVMTLNLAHGRNRAIHQALVPRSTLEANLDAIAATLRRESPDVVAFQEADGPSRWSGNIDHVETLRERAGLPHAFRGEHGTLRAQRFHASYGTAVLSQTALRDAQSVRFDLSWRDDKGFVRAVVDLPGMPRVEVVSVHLDYIRPAMRRRQAARMIAELGPRRGPRILMGDLNTSFSGSARCVISQLSAGLDLTAWEPERGPKSFPTVFPARRLDWILISRELRFRSCRSLPDRVSDHLGVVAEVDAA